MRPLRSLPILAPSFAAAALLAGLAAAGEPSPPPGWEAPPPLAAPGADTRGMPAGCAADKLCSVRQIANNATPPDRVERVVEVRFADLPALVVREAPAGGPPVTGAPALRIFAGGGVRAPWSVVPWGNVWAYPDGAGGEITWAGDDAWLAQERPFGRGPGYGAVHTIPKGTTDVRSILRGRVDYTTMDEGPGGALAVDYATGELVGTPDLVVSRWGHADAVPVAGRYLHAFRGKAPSDEAPQAGEDRAVTFVMPSVFVDFEAKDVKHAGGFMPIGHTIRASAYTSFTLPAGPGGSGIALFQLRAREIALWLPQPAGAENPPSSMRIAISSSQTSAEASPRVRVMFFVRDPSADDPRG